MGNGDDDRFVFPLTSLQIGDLQSYLSHLSLFLAPESKKLYILVDNRPWLKDLVSRPAHLWQLMVTKSRLSPFANTKGRKGKKETAEATEIHDGKNSTENKSKEHRRWFSIIKATTLSHERALLPVKKLRYTLISNSKLHRTLYGFIVFEASWNDVRGLNYMNELQTDTSIVVEAKFMNRWEFDSIAEAARSLSSWFPGTPNELKILKNYLDSAIGEVFYDAQPDLPRDSCVEGTTCNKSCCNQFGNHSSSSSVYPTRLGSETSFLHTPPPSGSPCKRRRLMKPVNNNIEFNVSTEDSSPEFISPPMHSQDSDMNDHEDIVEASKYRDILISFRFNDHDLPFKLRDIIVSDLRLLTLLEAGLPSWVIFLQSYPVFSHIYRPWMCPLARGLYVLISVVTVLIGFYDLYKNVPVLKATASHLFGPLFDWIESWEMITRIRYLGTMLFLHNCQKAIQWFLMATRTVRSFIYMLTQPVLGPLLDAFDFFFPVWNMCIQVVESFFSVFWTVIESSSDLVVNFFEILLMPIWCLLSIIGGIVTLLLYPLFCICWELVYAPIRLVLVVYGLLVSVFLCLYESFREIWLFVSGICQFGSGLKSTMTTVSSSEVSLWRSLWNDLFSQIFRAVRSILNGFVAFFSACNRHRLSIYNHSQQIVRRVHKPDKIKELRSSSFKRLGSKVSSPRGQTSQASLTLTDDERRQNITRRKFRKFG